MQAFHIIL